MKTASSLKINNKVESPKTPGGISKSLLTPCRRVGLSRNWKKSSPSPFISPLSGSTETIQESTDKARKRKVLCDEDPILREQHEGEHSNDNEVQAKHSEIDTTPSRSVSLPVRKKIKPLINPQIDKNTMEPATTSININGHVEAEKNKDRIPDENFVATPVRIKSKSRSKLLLEQVNETTSKGDAKENFDNKLNTRPKNCKQKSPENLTKECIVVIQKKIFKKDLEKVEDSYVKKKEMNPVSQALFDSDCDDVPLSMLNKNEVKLEESAVTNLDDDDFAENTKVKKLVDKTTSMGETQNKSIKKKSCKAQPVKKSKIESVCTQSKSTSQCSFDDDEDFIVDKRTILIRKSYNKVTRPLKAKSTGSITQKDIDELKARIEAKKKLLLAKAMTNDTEELRNLIKKWRKGCQDALMELMELMRNKFPDKQNMEYSEILQTLKIPASIVGYDEENDIFITPTDENIILSRFNDL